MSQFERPWYVWHVSSLLVFAISVALFVVLAVPGTARPLHATSSSPHVIYYGWPFLHLIEYEPNAATVISPFESHQQQFADITARQTLNASRWFVPATQAHSPGHYWSNIDNWHYAQAERLRVILWPGLISNVALGLLACIVVPILVERRRRRRQHFWQLGTVDLLVVLALVAAVVILPYRHVTQLHQDARVLSQWVEVIGPVTPTTAAGTLSNDVRPNVVVQRLSDYRANELPVPKLIRQLGHSQLRSVTITGLRDDGTVADFDPQQLAQEVNQLAGLQRVRAIDLNAEQAALFDHLDADRITEISLEGGLDDTSLHFLSYFKNLRRLTITNIDIRRPSLSELRLERLQELEVSFRFADETTIAWMAKQPRLKVLYLRTALEVQKLEQPLPGVHVTLVREQEATLRPTQQAKAVVDDVR